MSRNLTLVAALAVVLYFATASTADAGFKVNIEDLTGPNSGSKTFTYSGDVFAGNQAIIRVNEVIGDFLVAVEIVVSNRPGGPTLSFLNQSSNTILNLSGTKQTLRITATATDYTNPVTPPPVDFGSALSGNVTSGSLTNTTFNSYIGVNNQEYQKSIADQGIVVVLTNGPSGALSGETHTVLTNVGAPYSLTNILTTTLSGGANVTNLSGNTTITPVPVPPAFALMLSALPVGGLYYLRRRKKV